jgi:hypothetical protein
MTDKVTGTKNKEDSQIMRHSYKSGEMGITHYHLHLVTRSKMCGALSPCSLNGFMMIYIGKEQLTFIHHICWFYNFQRTMQELNNNLDLHFEY